MTGYLFEMNGDASLARKGWFVIIRAAGRVEENSRRDDLANCRNLLARKCRPTPWIVGHTDGAAASFLKPTELILRQ
jgi:hypothetical protein